MSTFTIQTPCGAVTGEETDGVRFYRAIPYAEAERFEGPVMTEHWDSTLDATQIESDCWQLCSYHDGPQEPGDFYYYEFLTKRDYHYAESPLQLSIIAPADAGGLPVLAFIHGGGFEVGKINELPYGTSTEYAKRGVVLVSIGYRLNIFGLYNGRNYCLEDQLCAVKWLRKNIAAYGGDPDRITLMGQSAGAMSITDLCLTDALKGDIVGAVLIPGAAAPKLVTRAMLSCMQRGAVLVDVAIDQGGCFETSHATTHSEPTYVVDGIVHYCVANMPGAVARTSTYALNNVTLPHALRIADLGWKAALTADPHLADGLNVWNGKITCAPVAQALGKPYVELAEALS